MKKCKNGHYFDDKLDACPYCPAGNQNEENEEETYIPTKEHIPSADKTKIFGGQIKEENPTGTKVYKGKNETVSYPASKKRDIDKTYIGGLEEDISGKGVKKIERANRKMVGWLVSYTIDEMGVDFRLYEGKNLIGSSPDCEITVTNDKVISGKHATILFRNNKFKIKDEFSTNGTYLNNNIVEDETPELKDGDILKVGNTIFKFKIAL